MRREASARSAQCLHFNETGFHHRRAVQLRSHQERSEEHTSELQSHVNLVCRLLLEKKKKKEHRKHSGKKSETEKIQSRRLGIAAEGRRKRGETMSTIRETLCENGRTEQSETAELA